MNYQYISHNQQSAPVNFDCDASELIANAMLLGLVPTSDELATIHSAKLEGNKITQYSEYMEYKGRFDGELVTTRARLDLDKICLRYGLYRVR